MNEMILETEDLRLRPTELEDLELFFAWERDPDVTRFFSIGDDQSREEVYCKYFNDLQDTAVRQFTICLKGYDADTVIGRVVISDIIEGWKAEIWRIYIGDTNLRGNGYGRQAMEAMLKYCFTELSLERLYLDHYTGNPQGSFTLSWASSLKAVSGKTAVRTVSCMTFICCRCSGRNIFP